MPLGGCTNLGAAIRFSEPIKPTPSLINLSDLLIEAFQGIIQEDFVSSMRMVISITVVTVDRVVIRYTKVGIQPVLRH